jgi:hypothetical protein
LSLSKLRGFEFPRRRKLKCFPLDSQIVFSCFNFILLLGSKRYELTTFFLYSSLKSQSKKKYISISFSWVNTYQSRRIKGSFLKVSSSPCRGPAWLL